MIGPRQPMDSGSRFQLLAVIAVTLLVMVLGVLVVVAPEQMGVPQTPATPVASPTIDVTEPASP